MLRILQEHLKKYPAMQSEDMVKLLYQAEFGGGHLVSDPDKSLQRLKTEIESISPEDAPLCEDIGGGMRRLHLRPLRNSRLSIETINRLFVYGANHIRGDMDRFLGTLVELEETFGDRVKNYLDTYRKAGCPAVSHSETYREHYHPAYRVIPGLLERLLPICAMIDQKLARQETVNIAIDGMCTSGKTTLAGILGSIYDANVFHADDYFLPLEKRTKERLASAGGNIDYERMWMEILSRIGQKASYTYRPFSCSRMALSTPVEVQYHRLNIVEGAYCMHPYFGKWYDLAIFSEIDPEMQRERILSRDGSKMLERFDREWIPMENKYIREYAIRQECKFVLRSENSAYADPLRI